MPVICLIYWIVFWNEKKIIEERKQIIFIVKADHLLVEFIYLFSFPPKY